jgi:ATP-dependent 26S proteasome regulatory subunit
LTAHAPDRRRAGDHSILTIATTNRLDAVEKALSARPSRFEQVIEIPAPDRLAQRAYLLSRAWSKADRTVNGGLAIDREVLTDAMKLCPGQRSGTLGSEAGASAKN